jgi:hypothetical protein
LGGNNNRQRKAHNKSCDTTEHKQIELGKNKPHCAPCTE